MRCWSRGLGWIRYLHNTDTLITYWAASLYDRKSYTQPRHERFGSASLFLIAVTEYKMLAWTWSHLMKGRCISTLFLSYIKESNSVTSALPPWILFQSLRTYLKGYLVNSLLRKYSPICENHRRNPGGSDGFSELSKSLLLKTGQCRLREHRPGDVWKEDISNPKVETQASDCVHLVAIY